MLGTANARSALMPRYADVVHGKKPNWEKYFTTTVSWVEMKRGKKDRFQISKHFRCMFLFLDPLNLCSCVTVGTTCNTFVVLFFFFLFRAIFCLFETTLIYRLHLKDITSLPSLHNVGSSLSTFLIPDYGWGSSLGSRYISDSEPSSRQHAKYSYYLLNPIIYKCEII